MHESPRVRRLRSDYAAMERLRSESSVLRFRVNGSPAQHYIIEFRGKSLSRFQGKVTVREQHEVEIKLGANYPRAMPEIRWVSPIYHPNISAIGMVCLGGYGTHWVPSLNLDELCGMLWDMARYHNYDVRSPYNREAALWVAQQTHYKFPLDARPLRDLRQALGRVDETAAKAAEAAKSAKGQAGSLASKYRSFLKRFADELNGLPAGSKRDIEALEGTAGQIDSTERASIEPDHPPEALEAPDEALPSSGTDPETKAEDEPTPMGGQDLIVIESTEGPASEPRPTEQSPVRLRAADEEIVFID